MGQICGTGAELREITCACGSFEREVENGGILDLG